jgi:hypothetical protein
VASTAIAAALAAFVSLAACGGDGANGPVATQITVLPATPSIRIGESVSLVATPKDASGNVIAVTAPITWSTGSATIATVDATGRVTGVSAGIADIAASVAQITGTTRVTVLRPPVARVDVAPASVSFGRAATRQLTASVFAADDSPLADRTIIWATSDAAVVTVSPTAGATVTLTAVAPGNATVSATSEDVKRDVAVAVQPDPVIAFAPPAASLGSTAGGANPAPLTITVSNSGGGTLSGLASGTVTYSSGQATGWLSAGFEGATSAPAPLTLRATTGTLPMGSYNASVPVSSTVPGVTPRTLAVTFNIGSAIVLGATPPTTSFTAPAGTGDPAARAIDIVSVNGTPIAGLAIGAIQYTGGQPTGWLTTAALSGTTTPATLTLRPSTGTLPAGTYTARVPIAAPTATNSPVDVAVTFVVPAPLIALSATAQSFTATQGIGAAAAQAVTISNGGRGSLTGLQATVSYGGGPTNWLNASLSATTAPATLTLTPVANNIARGTYAATVQVSAASVTNSPQAVSVSYRLVYTFDTHIAGTLAATALPAGCSNSSCHDPGGQSPVLGDGAASVYARLLNGYVSPGNPPGSVLYQRVSSAAIPMPPSGVNIGIRDAIAAWILDGARRN